MTEMNRDSMTLKTVGAFLAITFGLSWGLVAVLILYREQVEALFGPISGTNPVFVLAVWSPGIAGIFLVWRHYGVPGLKGFFRRLTLVHMHPGWWALMVLGIPAMMYLGAAIKGDLGEPFPFSPWYHVIPALLVTLSIGPVEEFGWRGVALPVLQRRFAPFWASMILGVPVAVWHFPAFVIAGTPQASWSFAAFFFGAIALTVLFTALFNASRGSLLIPVLLHFWGNSPVWPDGQPWDMPFLIAMTVVVVVVKREAMFSREGAATEVCLPPAPVPEPRSQT